jgi:FtsK/SpoIIIE family
MPIPFDKRARNWPWVTGTLVLLVGLLLSSMTLVVAGVATLGGVVVQGYRRRLIRQRFVDRFGSAGLLVGSFLLREGILSMLFSSCGLTRVLGGSAIEPTVVSMTPSVRGVDVYVHPVPGQTITDWRKASKALAMAAKVVDIAVAPAGQGDVLLTFVTEDPFAAPIHLAGVRPASSWALDLGQHADGTPALVSLGNRSGVVCAGQPGSGKTAGLRGSLAALMPFASVQFAIIDGKGSTDWMCFSSRCFHYIDDDVDLEAVVDALESLEQLRRVRAGHMLEWRGTSNFWDHGPTDDLPLVVVVIDECQTFFDANYQGTKEGKALSARAVALTSSLVKKGRSSGFLCICMTQRSVVIALPSQIRDNSGLRISYRVANRDGADVALGDGWIEAGESPIGLPQGVCVYTADTGGFAKARSPFVPESAIQDAARRFSGLVSDPRLIAEQVGQE